MNAKKCANCNKTLNPNEKTVEVHVGGEKLFYPESLFKYDDWFGMMKHEFDQSGIVHVNDMTVDEFKKLAAFGTHKPIEESLMMKYALSPHYNDAVLKQEVVPFIESVRGFFAIFIPGRLNGRSPWFASSASLSDLYNIVTRETKEELFKWNGTGADGRFGRMLSDLIKSPAYTEVATKLVHDEFNMNLIVKKRANAEKNEYPWNDVYWICVEPIAFLEDA